MTLKFFHYLAISYYLFKYLLKHEYNNCHLIFVIYFIRLSKKSNRYLINYLISYDLILDYNCCNYDVITNNLFNVV